jgi:hypothetical protein
MALSNRRLNYTRLGTQPLNRRGRGEEELEVEEEEGFRELMTRGLEERSLN